MIRSGRSEEMSDHEGIAQVTRFFEQIAHSLIFSLKTSDSLGKPMSEFPALIICLFIFDLFVLT